MDRIIRNNFKEMSDVLHSFIGDEGNVARIRTAAMMMVDALKNGHKIISCGNGGSMCDASHFSEELLARFRKNRIALPAVAISDPAYITCVGNDYGFDQIFSRYVEACGQAGDVLLGISTSGNSEDVIRAAEVARKLGLKVVVLTGKPNGRLTGFCDVEISAPPTRFSDRAQEIHIKVIHTLVQLIEIGMGLADEDDAEAEVEARVEAKVKVDVDANTGAGAEVRNGFRVGQASMS